MKQATKLLLIAVVLIGLLISINVLFFSLQKDESVSHIVNIRDQTFTSLDTEDGDTFGDVNITISADVEVTESCGEIDCFEDRFADCEVATTTIKLFESVVYFYEILGPKNGLCEVRSEFLENPNPEWVGETMTCGYDNSLDFFTAVEDLSNCEGDLYRLLLGY